MNFSTATFPSMLIIDLQNHGRHQSCGELASARKDFNQSLVFEVAKHGYMLKGAELQLLELFQK